MLPWPGVLKKSHDITVEATNFLSKDAGQIAISTETHEKLVFCLVGDFLRILPWEIAIIHHHLGEYVWNFFQASNKQIQENDDLTSEYLEGHVPKKTVRMVFR